MGTQDQVLKNQQDRGIWCMTEICWELKSENDVTAYQQKNNLQGVPSENFKPEGTTVHPNRTPVKPAYLEKELTSMATSLAPSIS